MIGIDPNMRKFYLDMGYTEPQIHKAFDQSQRLGIDVLDALNLPPEAQLAPASAPAQQPPSKAQPSASPNMESFLTPWKRIKQNDYEIFFSKNNKHQQSGVKVELREEDYPVGLLNVSNCCYLNSLIQCYFLLNDFKSAILTAQPLPNLEQTLANQSKTKLKRIKSEYQMLAKLKHFFTTMTLTSKRYLDPTTVLQNLVDSVGEKISYGEEKDLSEINILIIQRLSEGLTYSKNHYHSVQQQNLLNLEKQGSTIVQSEQQKEKRPFNSIFNPRQGTIKNMFYGTRAQYYNDPKLHKEQPVVSDFAGLILNPRAGSLDKALDEQFNFQVQINGGLQQKSAFIRDEPEYLFMYINRTDFDREEGQALKNQQKFTFDFTIYLDRYLQKYRKEHDQSHERIKELLASKNKLKEQINYIQILFKKIEDCQKYTQQLQGWADKLPKEQQFQQEFDRLESKLYKVESQLDQIQSRKEQYHLMYIFVHRGDAVSGHYWGYGRNDDEWYRFDINTRKILQDQINIDMEKSSATPYALLYVKEPNLPKFDYKIHLDSSILKQKFNKIDFRACLDPATVNQVVAENVIIHEKALIKNNQGMRDKIFSEYINRYNSVKKTGKRYEQQQEKFKHLSQVSISTNFSLFLWSKKEFDLCKFTIFEQSLYNVSGNKYTVQRLMHELPLLHLIQKKFKKNLRGELFLKFYSLLPKEVQKLVFLCQEYQISAFEVIWSSVVLNQSQFYQDQWHSESSKNKGAVFEPSEMIKTRIQRILRLIRIRSNLYKNEQFIKAYKTLSQPLFISQVNNEIVKLLLFSFVNTGIKIQSLQQFIDLSDQVGSQIIAINAQNSFVGEKSIEENIGTVEMAVQFISKFNKRIEEAGDKSNRRASNRSAVKNQDEKKMMSSSGFKNSLLISSPMKSQALIKQASSRKQQKIEYNLVTNISSIFVLQTKDSWKLQELQNLKINYELGHKLLTFLKKMGPLPNTYKQIIKEGKTFAVAQLRQKGVVVNQKQEEGSVQKKSEEESLI